MSVLTLLTIFSTGCESGLVNQSSNTPNQNENTPVALSMEAAKDAYLTAKENDTGPVTYDKILAEIALEVPGYGGHFLDEDGILNVYLLDDQGSETFKSIFRQHHDNEVISLSEDLLTDLRSRRGQYNFLQLYNWRVALRNDVLGMKGVTMLDINEAKNNITIGIEDLTLKDKILELIRQIGIPDDAISIVERDPMEYSVREKRTTLAGGLQIQYVIPAGTRTCTLGPVAWRNGVKGFIVNSHCSETQFSVDNQKYYQAKTSDRHIATERVNPPSFTGGDCPAGQECAYADAAFAEWENRGTWKNYHIYETEWAHPVSGSTKRVGTNFRVAVTYSWPSVGEYVDKVGRETGWTYGTVAETCIDTAAEGDVTFLCQYTAGFGSDGGDSGSPVFKTFSDGVHVYLYGILWGRNDNLGLSAFSNTNLIRDHLGGNMILSN